MDELSRENLQEFCRTCLKDLRIPDVIIDDANGGATDSMSYNIFVMPHLKKLMVLFTALDVSEENEAYPNSLCRICYCKLVDFHDFRELAMRSAQVLYDLVSGASQQDLRQVEQKPMDSTDTTATLELTTRAEENGVEAEEEKRDAYCDNNSQVLSDTAVKCEPLEEAPSSCNWEFVPVSERPPLESANGYDSALDNSDTNADDADDEECALRNGAANNSSVALHHSNNTSQCAPSSNNGSAGSISRRKRDRNRKSLQCPRCDKQAYKQVYLDAHIRAVHEGQAKPFVCQADACQKAFTRFNQLNVHTQAHHLQAEQRYECDYDGCDANYKLNSSLKTHRRVVHATAAGDAAEATPFALNLQAMLQLHEEQLERENAMEHICEQCAKKYSSKRALNEHLKRHAQIKEHVCEVCGAAKVTRTELQTHMRTHDPTLVKFNCPQCPQAFNHKNAIKRHVRVVHEGQRRFNCRYCSRRFGTRNSMVCHERLHTGERPFNCEVCEKSFAQLEGLKSHMKNHDKNLRKHVCNFCAQRFITRKNLLDHEGRHRGDKPHICNICSRGFYSGDDLATHQHILHTNTAEGNDADSDNAQSSAEQDDDDAGDNTTTAIKVELDDEAVAAPSPQ